MDRIAEIRKRCEAATPGPWDIILNGHNIKVERTPANIDFIAHAREDIPYLLVQLAERDKEIERLRKAQRWIPVSERLPEVDKEYGDVDVLVYTDEGIIEATTYDKDDGWGLWVEAGEVTHWMPLPEPPGKGE